MSSTDRVICLNGHVCCSGTPAVVATEPDRVRSMPPRPLHAMAAAQGADDFDSDDDAGFFDNNDLANRIWEDNEQLAE